MPNATAEMSRIDLDSEIESQRTRLQALEQLKQEEQQLQGRIRLVMQPMVNNPKILGAIKKADGRSRRAKNGKRLSDVVFESLIKKGPDAAATINELIEMASQDGYKSNSDQPQTVFRQMLQRDKRFKKHRVKGERQVKFGLSNSH